jgi:hypothetical protein
MEGSVFSFFFFGKWNTSFFNTISFFFFFREPQRSESFVLHLFLPKPPPLTPTREICSCVVALPAEGWRPRTSATVGESAARPSPPRNRRAARSMRLSAWRRATSSTPVASCLAPPRRPSARQSAATLEGPREPLARARCLSALRKCVFFFFLFFFSPSPTPAGLQRSTGGFDELAFSPPPPLLCPSPLAHAPRYGACYA